MNSLISYIFLEAKGVQAEPQLQAPAVLLHRWGHFFSIRVRQLPLHRIAKIEPDRGRLTTLAFVGSGFQPAPYISGQPYGYRRFFIHIGLFGHLIGPVVYTRVVKTATYDYI